MQPSQLHVVAALDLGVRHFGKDVDSLFLLLGLNIETIHEPIKCSHTLFDIDEADKNVFDLHLPNGSSTCNREQYANDGYQRLCINYTVHQTSFPSRSQPCPVIDCLGGAASPACI